MIESIYVLWKTTGEPKWRERGWKIFESIKKYAKTEYEYASVDKVDTVLRSIFQGYLLPSLLIALCHLVSDSFVFRIHNFVRLPLGLYHNPRTSTELRRFNAAITLWFDFHYTLITSQWPFKFPYKRPQVTTLFFSGAH
jgi:hypothetical protein